MITDSEFEVPSSLPDMFTAKDWPEYEQDYEPDTERSPERRIIAQTAGLPILGIDIGDEIPDTDVDYILDLDRVLSYIDEVNRDAPE